MWMYGEGSEAGAYFDKDVIDGWRTAWLFCPHINVASLAPHGDTGAPLRSTPVGTADRRGHLLSPSHQLMHI